MTGYTQPIWKEKIKIYESKIPTAPVASIESSNEKNESLSEKSRKRKFSEIEQERDAKAAKFQNDQSKMDASVLKSSDPKVDNLQ